MHAVINFWAIAIKYCKLYALLSDTIYSFISSTLVLELMLKINDKFLAKWLSKLYLHDGQTYWCPSMYVLTILVAAFLNEALHNLQSPFPAGGKEEIQLIHVHAKF